MPNRFTENETLHYLNIHNHRMVLIDITTKYNFKIRNSFQKFTLTNKYYIIVVT